MTDAKENPQAEADKAEALRILSKLEVLKTARTNWESHWQRCMENIVPRKEDITSERSPGDDRGDDLYDTTAILSNEMLASALHGMLTNPETRFFDLMFGDPALDEDESVRSWCQDVADRAFRILNSTNFQTEIYEVYIDLGAIGTAVLYMGEHADKVVHFCARPIKECFVDENNLGLIDTLYRVFKWKPRQIVQEFGLDALPDEVKALYEKGDETPLEIVHAVEPKNESEKKNPKDVKDSLFEFKSAYLLKDKKKFLSRSGYREFPYAVPRWSKTSGEIYGRGPGMSMLPDIEMVNAMMLTTLQGAQKTVDPPLMVADDGVIGTVRLTPGGLTVVRPGAMNDVPIKPLITDARVDFGFQCVEDVRKRIRSGFFIDQLQTQDGPQRTAEEIMHLREEKNRLMGPVLGRQHFELLRPLIARLFGVMVRHKLVPPAPAKIQNKDFDVRYSSLLARAQRMSEGQNLGRAIQVAAPIVQAAPSALDLVDSDAAIRYIFDIYGVPHKMLRAQVDVDKRREKASQMAQQQIQQQAEQHQAEVAKKTAPMLDATTRATVAAQG